MAVYEYKVVPAPSKGQKGKGAKGAPERFALALETLMNDLAVDGWEYFRADTLPCEERSGLTGSTTVFQNMLVFRRASAVTESLSFPRANLPEPPAARQAAVAPQPPTQDAEEGATPALDAPSAETPREEATAAAAAAAAALSAYRGASPPAKGRPLGPARRHEDDDNTRNED
ncbi:DUF4177 domain-containing protein [Tropicimonas isoalkanivorans]|uniref:DUF4177 domain-containing protein n=1 Tax=Tropicimonas isoalkanivorans TaxID=441112 RepID=A0A1I1G2C8_9RHOB|nr:DUF4177 domain-containing protein [Tropicimonas isoalkanivorans]SFC05907.1 hypothetical protein SAMN04488094_102395 [Tropicimonas isoalkanivorans]